MNLDFHAKLSSEIEQYFAHVSDEELTKDLEASSFAFYNSIGALIKLDPDEEACSYSSVDVSAKTVIKAIPAISTKRYDVATIVLMESECDCLDLCYEEMPLAV